MGNKSGDKSKMLSRTGVYGAMTLPERLLSRVWAAAEKLGFISERGRVGVDVDFIRFPRVVLELAGDVTADAVDGELYDGLNVLPEGAYSLGQLMGLLKLGSGKDVGERTKFSKRMKRMAGVRLLNGELVRRKGRHVSYVIGGGI